MPVKLARWCGIQTLAAIALATTERRVVFFGDSITDAWARRSRTSPST